MVRYSKLPFRLLARQYNVDVTYTPMMLAHEFIRSALARDSDFTTCDDERAAILDQSDGDQEKNPPRPHALVAQFASTSATEFARAASLIAPWVDGVDLNCGCPQSWAVREGLGCGLMADGERVASMVAAARAALPPRCSVSVKIRIHADPRETLNWVRVVEAAGVDWITVHGRTRSQRSSTPPDLEAIKIVKEAVVVPVVANGDVFSLKDARAVAARTGVNGVMAARGILGNPTLFAGYEVVPVESVRKFLEYVVRCPIPFPLVLHHINDMIARMPGTDKKEKRRLMACSDIVDVIDYVESRWGFA